MQRRMLRYFIVLLWSILIISCIGSRTTGDQNKTININTDFAHRFDSPQIVSIIEIPKENRNFTLSISSSDDGLTKTSDMALDNGALAAINGGFFNVKEGYSVTYLEQDNLTISPTRASMERQSEPSYFLNGAIVINKNGRTYIEAVQNDEVYKESKKERAVLVTGPILLNQGRKAIQKKIPFVEKRHPRSCFCISDSKYFFIAIDGRSEEASGMSLYEVQDYLLELGCKEAINLDGGGSTTLWHQQKGVINHPSDKKGERPVANALIVLGN